MAYYSESITKLIDEFCSLPGIGQKSAQRIVFSLLKQNDARVKQFAETMLQAKKDLCFCRVCCNYSEGDICDICANPSRDRSLICVVEDPKDVIALERTNEFHGLYHVLHGVMSPMAGIGAGDIKLTELVSRVNGDVKEIIVATNTTVEGEATAMYIAKLLKPLEVKVTRIANGIPVGGNIEYADEITLAKSLQGRHEI